MSSSSRNRRQPPRPAAAARPAAQRPALQAAQQDGGTWEVPDDGVFDLDAVVHEARDERFRFKAGPEGPERRIWELRTPQELDWQENSRIPEQNPTGEDLRPILRLLLGDQYDDFTELDITIGQVGALIEQWQEWHGIKVPESDASRRS